MYVNAVKFTAKPGRAAEVVAGVVAFRGIIERVSGVEARAWSVLGGEPAGTVAVSGRMASMGQYVDVMAKLAADTEYQALTPTLGDAIVDPASIELNRLVHATDGFKAKSFTSITSAVVTAGHYKDAYTWCAEFVEFVHSVTGEQAAFVTGAAGAFGSVGIYVSCADGDTADEANEKLGADEGYLDRLLQAGSLFEPGSGHQRLLQHIA